MPSKGISPLNTTVACIFNNQLLSKSLRQSRAGIDSLIGISAFSILRAIPVSHR